MADSWKPMTGLDLTEMESYLASYRENNPLTESEVKTRDFYSALFAEHFGGSVDTICDAETSSDEDEPRPEEVTLQNCDSDLVTARFVAACEKNSFEEVEVSDLQLLPSDTCAVLSAKAIINLLRWTKAGFIFEHLARDPRVDNVTRCP